ncbi:Pyridoxamine 5'-phosphate oxidase-related, FMN-binding [Citrifermentans bremense]|uniref:Pyridoxamine 5'-phosphate oxidase-related, FMN-binding n=1 Tax=Citrifermentans bremense TaxID=60035 RepID=A0A6S6M076_9BACT|nr:pyridoxamine 5'-phosphate oxidase family protein [Citrifermentans bremense]BCG45586.1 Pyridoxamine 5'-phosphate oxidase-related, FMN-binding [Citrifermentans bremense]
MKLAELFPEGGRGVIATADAAGVVNQAVFAIPHVVDEQTLAWGFSDGRSIANLRENPHASYLYLAPSRGYSGWRLSLTMKEELGEGDMLEKIKSRTAQVASPEASSAVTRVAYFKVDEVRPLI